MYESKNIKKFVNKLNDRAVLIHGSHGKQSDTLLSNPPVNTTHIHVHVVHVVHVRTCIIKYAAQ